MKYLLVLTVALLSQFGYAQKAYSFDYLIEYEYFENETSKPVQRYLMTNSRDNSYHAVVVEENKKHYTIQLTDEAGEIRAKTRIRKSELANSQILYFPCDEVKQNDAVAESEKQEWSFSQKSDTVIDNKAYKQYGLRNLAKPVNKKYPFGDDVCVIETDTEFHVPIFNSGLFNETVKTKIPNGIAKLSFTEDVVNHKRLYVYKLVGFTKIKQSAAVPKPCG